jgi:hypothetical protein
MAVSTWLYVGGGLACLWRGLMNPYRAVVKSGSVAHCSGPNNFKVCDAADTITADPGTPSYAVTAGKVVAVGQNFVHLLARNEPVILMYHGLVPAVVEGQYVGRGQTLGAVDGGGTVQFSVTELVRALDGALGYVTQVVPPSAWLASRGATHAVKDLGDGSKWCEGGRKISVPNSASTGCDMKTPDPGMFGLLPVNIEME